MLKKWPGICLTGLTNCSGPVWSISTLRNQHSQENQILFPTGKVSKTDNFALFIPRTYPIIPQFFPLPIILKIIY